MLSWKRPIFWGIIAFLVLSICRNFIFHSGEDAKAIYSDGRGYYAYLPAIFLHNDPTYKEVLEIENKDTQYYVFQDDNGDFYNKYFPGIAVLQSPFFAIATLFDTERTGYSSTYKNWFYIGHIFYAILGILLFTKLLHVLFRNRLSSIRIDILVLCILVATPLLYYLSEIPLTHNYTFFLFACFALLVVKLKENVYVKYYFLLGLVFGMILLVRPTNGLVVLAIPLLLQSKNATANWFRKLFANRGKHFMAGLTGMLVILSVLPMIWKWQSGTWFIWTYSGEGFYWLHPKFFATFFSFRVGLFLQSPIVIFFCILAIFLWRKNKWFATWWGIYFLMNAYVISSWWCWDYESSFGHRPFTEHMLFLCLPLFFVQFQRKNAQRILTTVLGITVLMGLSRYYAITTGYMPIQRFTAKNYFPSLAVWNKANFERWNFTQSCKPFGELEQATPIFNREERKNIDGEEFLFTRKFKLSKSHSKKRYFTITTMELKYNGKLEDVLLAFDMKDGHEKHRYCYQSIFSDRFGNGNWQKVKVIVPLPDNFSEFNQVSFYMWNLNKQKFTVRNISVNLHLYASE